MRMLVVDNDQYVAALYRALEKQGSELTWARLDDAVSHFRSLKHDVGIIDILAGSNENRALHVCRELCEAGCSSVIVYCRITKEEFVQRATAAGIDVARVQFYSKSLREVPPPLMCIEDRIKRCPGAIGILDLHAEIPKKITAKWIASRDSVYAWLAEFVMTLVCKKPDVPIERVLTSLPGGMHRIWSIVRLTSEVENGGFHQFYANNDLQVWMETLAITEHMGLKGLTQLIKEGIAICRSSTENANAINRLETLDDRYHELEVSWIVEVDRYVKDHPDEFVCETGVA